MYLLEWNADAEHAQVVAVACLFLASDRAVSYGNCRTLTCHDSKELNFYLKLAQLQFLANYMSSAVRLSSVFCLSVCL